MGLTHVGTLPVSALNIGLAAAPPVIAARIAELTAEITNLGTLQIQAGLAFKPPAPAELLKWGASLASALLKLPASIAASFTAMLNPTFGAATKLGLGVDIGLLIPVIELVLGVHGDFEAGLSSGGLAAWSYAGRASGFGDTMAVQTSYADAGPGDHVQGFVLATEDFASWGSFGAGFNVGDSADEVADAGETELTHLGTLGGGELNTGVLPLFDVIAAYLFDLEARKFALEASLEVSIGLNLPDIDAMFGASFSVPPIPDLIGALSLPVDLSGSIADIQLRIDALLELTAQIELALSGGGLTVWVYAGSYAELGTSLQGALAGGLPGGNGPNVAAYGLSVVCAFPTAWADFGRIFKVGA